MTGLLSVVKQVIRFGNLDEAKSIVNVGLVFNFRLHWKVDLPNSFEDLTDVNREQVHA